MSVLPNGAVAPGSIRISKPSGSPFVARCRCGRLWTVTMERGESGNAGCLRCSCQAEIVSWSGTVIFSGIPADVD
jgi:hypothetical protein